MGLNTGEDTGENIEVTDIVLTDKLDIATNFGVDTYPADEVTVKDLSITVLGVTDTGLVSKVYVYSNRIIAYLGTNQRVYEGENFIDMLTEQQPIPSDESEDSSEDIPDTTEEADAIPDTEEEAKLDLASLMEDENDVKIDKFLLSLKVILLTIMK